MALSDTLLKSALDLAARGFKVFPVTPGARKPPAIGGWQTRATTNEAQIKSWWANKPYNIGVFMDKGRIAVDIDVKSGKVGAQSFKKLNLSTEERDTFRVKTASGGWHVYYSTDDDFGNSPGDIGPDIDIRGGGRGYVLGPGSVLTNGSGEGAYKIEHDAPVRALPEAIRTRLRTQRERTERSIAPAVELDRIDAIDLARSWLTTDAPVAVEGGGGDLTTYKVAARLKDFGVSKETAFILIDEHWNERCSPPWGYDELQEKIENAYAYGLDVPGSAHPVAVFSGIHVDLPGPAPVSKWIRHGDARGRIDWLYYELFPAVGVAAVVGLPGSGKTFLEIELARSLATGSAFFGMEPDEPGGSVFLFGGTEGSGLHMRLAALGANDRRLPISATTVQDLSSRGAFGALLTTVREEAARMFVEFGVPLRLVVLETLSASGLLVNENDNSEMSRAMANLATLARELKCLVVTTHHPPKTGEGERGAFAFRGSIDYMLTIEREGRDNLRRLELTKARDAEQRQIGTFTLLKVDLGKDDRGRPITSMAVSMGKPMVKDGKRAQYSDIFMTAMDFALVEGGDDIEGHKAVEWSVVQERFRELKGGGHLNPGIVTAFKRCAQYATDIGAVGSGVYAGVRYLWIKEILNDA